MKIRFETNETKQRNDLTSRTRAKQSETKSDPTQGAAQFPKISSRQPLATCSRNFFPFFEKNEEETRENEEETAENGTGNGDSGKESTEFAQEEKRRTKRRI